jgi:CubicO group peptidase (beta-lactamase class C family)
MTELSSSPRLLESTERRLLALAARGQRDGRLPSLVSGIVRGDGLIWSAGFGAVDGEEPGSDVQYRIGSITKTVTAVAVLRLRDEGLLALGDPLDRHVPGTPFGDRTIGQLLAHDAGLRAESPGEWWERVPGRPWSSFAGQFTEQEIKFPAGRRFHYSNIGFAALGEVVARLRGRPWAEVVRDEVLLPLGMTRTTPRPDGRSAQGWAVHPWADIVLAEPEHDAAAMAPAGQLWATPADLGRFAAFLMTGGDVLSRDTVEEMREPAAVDGSSPIWAAYGLGLQLWRPEGRILIGHSGSMPGFLAMLMIDVAEETAALNLMNATTGLPATLTQDLLKVVREAEPHVVAPWAPLPAPDAATLELTGQWYWGVTAYGLRLEHTGELALIGLLGGGRASRFRKRDDGSWAGLVGYHAGETLAPVRSSSGELVALDIGGFLFTRTPYDPAAPVPGGVDPQGWR